MYLPACLLSSSCSFSNPSFAFYTFDFLISGRSSGGVMASCALWSSGCNRSFKATMAGETSLKAEKTSFSLLGSLLWAVAPRKEKSWFRMVERCDGGDSSNSGKGTLSVVTVAARPRQLLVTARQFFRISQQFLKQWLLHLPHVLLRPSPWIFFAAP